MAFIPRKNRSLVQLVTMGANHMVKREVLLEIGAHDERFGPGEVIEGAGADLD